MGLLEGRSAVVTGAGRGIGRDIALCLAAEGARVVVNDVGVSLGGEGTKENPAAQVCAEIEAAGGTAVPNYDSVSDHDAAARIIATAGATALTVMPYLPSSSAHTNVMPMMAALAAP